MLSQNVKNIGTGDATSARELILSSFSARELILLKIKKK